MPSPTALLPFGYAEAVTDTGHESVFGPAASLDGSFALLEPGNIPNMAAIEDFAYRAVHLSTLAGQNLTNQYYVAPMFSYFDGCSTGGRQALVEAQKFPADFNGIVAGDPAISDPIAGFNWNDLALLTDSAGDSWLPPSQIAVLDAAVTSACDASDGVVDGLIEDPRLCNFDPASIQCSKKLTSNCLTAAQVATVKKIYAGATTPDGTQLYPGYTASNPGGNDGWEEWITGFAPPPDGFGVDNPYGVVPASFGAAPLQFSFQDQFMKFFVFDDPSYNSLTFDFADPTQVALLNTVITNFNSNGEDTDLSPFFGAGGKLVMYHGWSDPALTPFVSVDYYTAVAQTLGGGFKHLQDDARLFMVPGMHHCSGGPGPYNFDPLTPLTVWVESGVAPARIIGEVPAGPQAGRTFPLCPFPSLAVFQGGNVNDATNWVCKAHTNHRFSPGQSKKGQNG
ncbi:tannase/feruloyl esterase family alpha/beta hydrolase [Candidatus Binatus sp.]|uniref:tannase/feruloyl esterase family alpha/beta hydrolase n=1 Tax=Candidatus Binatus sp. TaxID=2811406 RepID=UPI003BAE1886